MKVQDWIKDNQNKHICKCGCDIHIYIQRHHKYYGIPKYVHNHDRTKPKEHLLEYWRNYKRQHPTKSKRIQYYWIFYRLGISMEMVNEFPKLKEIIKAMEEVRKKCGQLRK